jgi:rfaE bifunctional protein kinase chain/domain
MDTLDDFFKRTGDYHILVIGDVMLDCYLTGRVDRISPEAPVPVLQLQSTESRLGGAANVALNLSKLGAKVSVMGIIGDDPAGNVLRNMLEAEGIGCSLLTKANDAKTTLKTRVIGGHQHLLRIDEEKHRESTRPEAVTFRQKLDALTAAERPHAIILQDYNKGFLSPPMIRMLLNYAKENQIPVAVDPKEVNFFEYNGVAIFKPNLRELRARVPFPIEANAHSLEAAATYLSENIRPQITAITLSEHGIYLASQSESGIFPTQVRTVVDVCGAGDAVIAVLALAHLMGANLGQMAALANAAGGVVCGEVGVCPVDVGRMREEIGDIAESRGPRA